MTDVLHARVPAPVHGIGAWRGLMQRSEIRLAGDTICRPFAPDGEFRHVPSFGQLKLMICHSLMTGEEAK
jgi:hypothetical protein